MKKLLLALLLFIPFSTFASTYDEVKNIEIKIKNKTYNGITFYQILEKAIDKKSKGNKEKKLKYYEKLIKKTENKSNNTFKKINTILKYGKNQITSKEINSEYSYEEQLNFYPFYTKNLNEDYFKGSKGIKYQFENAYKRLSKGKNKYNNLTYDILVDDYNLALSIYKDGGALKTILNDSETRKRLNKKYGPGVFDKLSQKFLDSGYRNENGLLTYNKELNILRNQINAEYIGNNNEETGELVFKEIINKNPSISWEEYKTNLKNENNGNSKDGVAYYGSNGTSLGHGNFSDAEIRAYSDYKFNKQSDYEKLRNSATFFAEGDRTDYFEIDSVTSNLESLYNRYKEGPNGINDLIYNELVEDYNLYLSIYKDGGAIDLIFDSTKVEKYVTIKLMKERTGSDIDFIINLGYTYENGKIIYKEELNTLKNVFSKYKYIKQ